MQKAWKWLKTIETTTTVTSITRNIFAFHSSSLLKTLTTFRSKSTRIHLFHWRKLSSSVWWQISQHWRLNSLVSFRSFSSSRRQSFSSRMSNSTLSIENESMTTMITLKIWDFHKRNAYTIGLNENSRVRMHDNATFTSASMYLIILQNTHLKFSIISKSTTELISQSSNQPSNLAMSRTRIQISYSAERSASYWASRYWLFRNWVCSTSSLRHRVSVQISAHVSIIVSTSKILEDLIVIDNIDEKSIDIEDHNSPSLKKYKRTKIETCIQSSFWTRILLRSSASRSREYRKLKLSK